MKINLKKYFIISLLLIIIVFFTSCNENKFYDLSEYKYKISKGKEGGIINLSYTDDINNLNPFLNVSKSDIQLSYLLYDSIATYNIYTKKLEMNMADKIEQSSDSHSINIYIKNSLTDSDGNSIDSSYISNYFNLLKEILTDDSEYGFLSENKNK